MAKIKRERAKKIEKDPVGELKLIVQASIIPQLAVKRFQCKFIPPFFNWNH